jgi:hypothetical protein
LARGDPLGRESEMLLRISTRIAAVTLTLFQPGTSAAVYQMECREWRSAQSGGDYLGSYVFSFDSNSKSLSISYKPEMKTLGMNALFGTNVKTWTLLWEKDLNACFTASTMILLTW